MFQNKSIVALNTSYKAKKKYIRVFQVSALKKLGMVGRHNILSKYFLQKLHFFTYFSPFSSKFDNILHTIHNKMFRVWAKT